MKRSWVFIARLGAPLAVFAAWTLAAPPASAQVAVYDPANHAQNILQAARALQEVEQQIQQLTHEIEMLENMARDLEALPVNVAEAIIEERLARIDQLIRDAAGIGSTVEAVERGYDSAYPESYGEVGPGSAVLVDEARARWRQSRAAFRDALKVSAAALQDNPSDAAAIAGLTRDSQAAAGNLQALQAGNQLDALQAQQLMQLEAMMGANFRAEALERARELAEAERGRARTAAFLGN